MVVPMHGFSALAGGVVLGMMMIPLVMRTTEEVLQLVPGGYREAALALGIAKWKTIVQIVIRTALKGIVTGVLLALARVAGETAPLLFTALWQRTLGAQTHRTHRRHAAADFRLRHFALRRLAPAGVGGRAGAAAARAAINAGVRFLTRDRFSRKEVKTPMSMKSNRLPTNSNPPLPALVVRNLAVFFGESRPQVKNVSLDIAAKAVTAIIGPSGCGKSTFLRALNRMHELNPEARMEGEIKLFGDDIYSRNVEPVIVRRRVGMVFQKSNPFPTMSISENVTVGLRLNGIRDKKISTNAPRNRCGWPRLWDEVKDRLHAPAISLSGGQQQRLCIARALAVQPEVLLMDEPASALDPLATSKIEDLILQLKKDYTIVIVTHNMQQAARVSDFTAFFYLGELVEFDVTAKIFTSPSQKQTEDYVTGRFG
jgi:phosphate transport system ATP-binding protein